MLARPRLKGAKAPSMPRYVKPPKRSQTGTPTGHSQQKKKKGMNYLSQKHLNQKKTVKNIHIFDVN